MGACNHARHIGANTAWSAIRPAVGGEADLVVDDQMNGAAGGVAIELRQIQRLRHHALSGKGGVAVHQERDDALALRVAQPILLRPHDAFHHRIDSFQMARD